MLPSSDSPEDWHSFLTDWHAAQGLGHDHAEVRRGLRGLVRHWPEYWDRIVRQASRGLGVVAPAVDTGLLLADVESLPGFEEVRRRVVTDERSAYSEVVLAGTLLRLGYQSMFGSPISGRVLDTSCIVEGRRIYFEVVAPNRSDSSQARISLSKRLSDALQRAQMPGRTEVEMLDGYSDDCEHALLEAACGAPDREWIELPGIIRLRRVYPNSRLLPLFDSQGLQVYFGGEREIQGTGASVVVKHESSDERAKRVFNEEYHQFSADVPNVLVVNTCAVSDGFRDWPEHMARLLQPARNRRVGAVVFYDQGCLGPPERIRRRWRCLVNPNAHHQVAESLIRAFESVDEQAAYGLPSVPRLTAAG